VSEKFTKLFHALDGDDDFNALPREAQHLYLRMLAHPSINYAGIIDWRPNRWINKWPGATLAGISKAAGGLRDGGFAYFDTDTEEALIRAFVRRDGFMKSPNMAVAMKKAHALIASSTLKKVSLWELQRYHHIDPDLAGWDKVRDLLSNPLVNPSDDPSVNPSIYPQAKGSAKGSVNPSPTPNTFTPNRSTPDTAQSDAADAAGVRAEKTTPRTGPGGDRFEEFWSAYGKKVGKGAARKAWAKAVKTTDAQKIIDAATEHAAWHRQERTEARYIPHPSSWLNAERWTDERAGRATASTSSPTTPWQLR
jgi:hypothetical protein